MSKSTTRIAKLLDLEKSKTGNARAIVDWFMLIVNRLFREPTNRYEPGF